MKESYEARLLRERDEARDAGDQLAKAIGGACSSMGPSYDFDGFMAMKALGNLKKALEVYVKTTGWNGPAGSWARNPPYGVEDTKE